MQNYLLETSANSYIDTDSDRMLSRNKNMVHTHDRMYEPYGGFPPLVICSKIQNMPKQERQITNIRAYPKRELIKIDAIMKRRREQQQRLISTN